MSIALQSHPTLDIVPPDEFYRAASKAASKSESSNLSYWPSPSDLPRKLHLTVQPNEGKLKTISAHFEYSTDNEPKHIRRTSTMVVEVGKYSGRIFEIYYQLRADEEIHDHEDMLTVLSHALKLSDASTSGTKKGSRREIGNVDLASFVLDQLKASNLESYIKKSSVST